MSITSLPETEKKKKKKRHTRSHRAVKAFRYFAARRTLSLFFLLPSVVPLSLALRLGTIMGRIAYYVPGAHRKQGIANLDLAFGEEMSSSELRLLMQGVGVEVSKTALEVLYSLSPQKGQLYTSVTIEGREHLDAALDRGKGVIAITAHLGNFFVIEGKLISEGYPFRYLLKLPKDKGVASVLETKMEEHNIRFILAEPDASSQKKLIRCLRQNEIIGITLDQDQKVGGIPIKVMGQEVSIAPGPAILAKRTDATILPLFIIRQPDNSHKIIVEPPVERIEGASQDRSIVLLTMQLARIIESYIAQYPQQWYWATKPHRHARYHPRLKEVLDQINRGEEEGKVSFSGK